MIRKKVIAFFVIIFIFLGVGYYFYSKSQVPGIVKGNVQDLFARGANMQCTFKSCQQYGVNYFTCGHHATERYGIKALGEHLAAKFDLNHQYIEINNPF